MKVREQGQKLIYFVSKLSSGRSIQAGCGFSVGVWELSAAEATTGADAGGSDKCCVIVLLKSSSLPCPCLNHCSIHKAYCYLTV